METKTTNNVNVSTTNRSRHDLSNDFLGNAEFGFLNLGYVEEVLPGDSISFSPSLYLRTNAVPVANFANLKVSCHQFFVPNRLLWKGWEKFLVGDPANPSGQKPYFLLRDLNFLVRTELGISKYYDGNEPTNFRGRYSTLATQFGLPVFQYGGDNSALIDVPSGSFIPETFEERGVSLSLSGFANSKKLDALPYLAYQRIWWDYFRDSNLIGEETKDFYCPILGDGHISNALPDKSPGSLNAFFETKRVCYEKDYFTTMKVSPQQGDEALINVDVPPTETGESFTGSSKYLQVTGDGGFSGANTSASGLRLDGVGKMRISALRLANSLQRYLEKNNIAGSRPIAQILARWGVAPSAERLDMAEYIGGSENTISMNDVVANAGTESNNLGEMGGYYVGSLKQKPVSYTAKEHGFFISVFYVIPKVGYVDGLDPMWTRDVLEDYFLPEYENCSFRGVPVSELYAPTVLSDGPEPFTEEDADVVIGYVPRSSEYKYKRDVLAQDFVRWDTALGNDKFHSFRRFNRIPHYDSYFSRCVQSSLQTDTFSTSANWHRLFFRTALDYEPFIVSIHNSAYFDRPMEGFANPALANLMESSGRRVTIPYGGVRL